MERLEQRLALTDYSSTDVPIDIEDAGTITSTLAVPDAFVITDVNVTLNITHTLDTELEVFLVAHRWYVC